MKLIIGTKKQEMTVAITITSFTDAKICIEAYDYDNPKTYFLTRFKDYKGVCTFKIMLPISPEKLCVKIYNQANGDMPKNQDTSFRVDKVKREKLQTRLQAVPWGKYDLKDFVNFVYRFAYNLNYLPVNQTYVSDKGKFAIELLPTIIDEKSGRELNTPARINKATGKIQASARAFSTFTVPQIIAIMCHEISHFWINENPDDESEADLNGLTIYLALGFPRVEAYDAFLDTFEGAPTDANKKRFEIIDKFIKDFDKKNIVIN